NAVNDFIQTVRVMSEVKVVRRWSQTKLNQFASLGSNATDVTSDRRRIKLIAMGASIGGPPALASILGKLDKIFPVPIVICQHIAGGFVEGLAVWLEAAPGFQVRRPVDGEPLIPGFAYVAPDGLQMGVTRADRIALTCEEPEGGLRPA